MNLKIIDEDTKQEFKIEVPAPQVIKSKTDLIMLETNFLTLFLNEELLSEEIKEAFKNIDKHLLFAWYITIISQEYMGLVMQGKMSPLKMDLGTELAESVFDLISSLKTNIAEEIITKKSDDFIVVEGPDGGVEIEQKEE